MARIRIDSAKILERKDRIFIENAAYKWGLAMNADPFARIRITHYMKMGFELPSDVMKKAEALLAAREGRRAYIEMGD